MDKKGIKESKELIEALALLAKAGKEIAADGKVSVSDLEHLVALGKDFNILLEGFKDLKELDDELKDIDEAEAIELLSLLFKKVKDI